MIESAKRASTGSKLDTIEKALYAYRVVNNRLLALIANGETDGDGRRGGQLAGGHVECSA